MAIHKVLIAQYVFEIDFEIIGFLINVYDFLPITIVIMNQSFVTALNVLCLIDSCDCAEVREHRAYVSATEQQR